MRHLNALLRAKFVEEQYPLMDPLESKFEDV